MRLIRVSYAVVSPESAELGCFAETGMMNDSEIMEPDSFDVEEGLSAVDKAVSYLHSVGPVNASSSCFHTGIWYSGPSDLDYQTGNETTMSFHLDGFTFAEQEDIYHRVAK